MGEGTGPVHFINLEYFFRLIYESRPGGTGIPSFGLDAVGQWFLHMWNTFAGVSFVFSLIGLLWLAYATMRMYQIKQAEHHLYEALDPDKAEHDKDRSRWAHVQMLIESPQERDWREAINEADIMLEDMLRERGYEGQTIAERLKKVDPKSYTSLQEAWEAHKMRNRVIHEGIAFKLSDQMAYRTIKQYGNVFREFGEI